MTIRLWIIFGALALLPALASTEARAQASRTWVSGVGDDVNPCSRTAPCKTFAGAISKTAAGGEINALDSGGFGAVTITKSITIKADGVTGGVLSSLTNGVTVNTPANGKVVLEGLDIDGVGTGLNGVRFLGQGSLTVMNCRIRNVTQAGILMQGAADFGRLLVTDTFISSVNIGIHFTGPKANVGVLNRVTINLATTSAIKLDAPSSASLSDSSISASGAGLTIASGASLASYGNNVNRNSGTPTSTINLQ
jgi:hypothetical protein